MNNQKGMVFELGTSYITTRIAVPLEHRVHWSVTAASEIFTLVPGSWIYLLNSIHSLRVWISNSRGTSGPPCSAPIAPIMAPPRHQSWVTAPGSVFITGVWQHIDRQPVKYTMASEYTGQVCVNEMWKVSIYNISRPIIRDLIIELFSSYIYLGKLTSQHHEAQPLFKPYFFSQILSWHTFIPLSDDREYDIWLYISV